MREARTPRQKFIIRARILCSVFVLAAILIVVRLYFLQIVHGAEYREEALGQYKAQAPQTPHRGAVYFSAKDGALVSAAVMQSGWRIAIDPRMLSGASGAYTRLNAIVPINRKVFMDSASKK